MPETRKLFGTDGIRGIAGQQPLDPATIFAMGLALSHSLQKQFSNPRVVLGCDTRESSPWIASTIAAGFAQAGVEVVSAGVITTPGIAFVARKHAFSAGIVISASHNPWEDNGIKVFGHDGFKLPDEVEAGVEAEIFRRLGSIEPPDSASLHPPAVDPELVRSYEEFLRSVVPGLNLNGRKLILDCANGAASAIAPDLFAGLGGQIDITHAEPNGRNINANCGALHPEIVAAEVTAAHADLGVTFDGDADRALFADATGRVVNGDAILLLTARDLKQRGQLTNNIVVATTMSNMGLEAALRRDGIQMLRAPVGDKYVLEWMQKHDAALGGEQSGHIIFPHLSTTGDGLLTALVVLDTVARSGKPLHELIADLKVFPQVIVNIRVREKRPLDQIGTVADTIRAAESDLDGNGRVVVRYSGTEALARVMIEAESRELMQHHADRIAGAIRAELGA